MLDDKNNDGCMPETTTSEVTIIIPLKINSWAPGHTTKANSSFEDNPIFFK